ncbi:MAG TPA: hopanoid biosynthesis-associated protein HpnK [Verrucomicrobiae bacterium]|nr:hopanoid biosynthesis-associated protein HpnK [Verrucomicrobiae bacterium]
MGVEPSAAGTGRRRLIVNADDFGRSASINQAVIRAHCEGILTTASLMVNEPASQEAVELARKHPSLGVGLHLTLLCGHAASPRALIPGLVNSANEFTDSSFEAGFRYFFQTGLHPQLRQEVHAQFARFRATGLPLDHLNGHLHLHLHPVIFRILMRDANELGISRVRLTRDPFVLNLGLASGALIYRTSHAVIFHSLSARARPKLEQRGFKHTDRVFGLLQNARVDEEYVCRLLERLPTGDSELYSHPSLDEFKEEFAALISPRVRERIQERGIQLIRYQDL